ncbi:hypothetical protein [Rubritalea tangerina]|uniref:hypothetical protein n=1 Tax=Rubritalea tangerina TaxID=430798 RepID=UPI003618561F
MNCHNCDNFSLAYPMGVRARHVPTPPTTALQEQCSLPTEFLLASHIKVRQYNAQ